MGKVLSGEVAEVTDEGRALPGGEERDLSLTVEDIGPGVVRMDFGFSLRSFDMTDEQAEQLAQGLMDTAKKARARRGH